MRVTLTVRARESGVAQVGAIVATMSGRRSPAGACAIIIDPLPGSTVDTTPTNVPTRSGLVLP